MEDSFPDFCYGPMYILSIPAMFVQKFKDQFLWLEDVYLTGTNLVNDLILTVLKDITGILAKLGNITKKKIRLRKFLEVSTYNRNDVEGVHMDGETLETIQEFWQKWQFDMLLKT